MEVLVIGAGLGGLTFAALATRNPDVRVTVVERDTDLRSRPQGYGVGLRGSQGLAVLARIDPATAAALPVPVTSFAMLDTRGRVLRRVERDDDQRLAAVPRMRLRHVLVDQSPPGTVTWGARAVDIRPHDDGAVVVFEDGTERHADLVVAADGARSAARSLLLGRELSYTGLLRIGGVVPRLDHPLLQGGVMMTLGDGCSTFVQAFSEQQLAWSFTLRAREDALEDRSSAELLRLAVTATRHWHDPVPAVLADTDVDGVTVRGLYDLVPPDTARVGRVAFIGDAVHPMTPYRGVGANMAMMDAAALADALATAATLEGAIDGYEREMLPRNATAVRHSHDAALALHPTGRAGRIRRDLGLRLGGHRRR